MRLLYELREFPNSIFVTLTFDEPSLCRFKDNPNKSLSLFLDRVRKKYGKQVRHWFVSEYGKKRGRLHYHGILFDIDINNDDLESLWQYGNTFVGYANDVTARYIVKYLTKDDTKGVKKPPRVISSKGIGSSFLDTHDCKLLQKQLATSFTINGYKVPLPRYYLDKMYNEREKELISYYLYMESEMTYYLNGREYKSEKLYELARKREEQNYSQLGLIYSGYEVRPKISSQTRLQILFDCINKYESYF